MRTPKEYTENLKKGIVTLAMLEDVLFSYNKRAKNYRDKAKQYRNFRYDKYNNEEKCIEKKEMLYEKKSDILKYCPNELKAVHTLVQSRRIRIEDNEPEYLEYESEISKYEKGKPSEVVYMNSYYDHNIDEDVTFINVYIKITQYFLYYEFPNHSFHQPINKEDLERYKNLKTVEIDNLTTYGNNVKDLISLPFCDKVWEFLKSKHIQLALT